MANAILWQAAWTTTGAGTVLSTELNSITTGNRSNAGTEIDNSSACNQYACFELYFASFTPTGSPYVTLYMLPNPDCGGTNYAEGSSSVDPGNDRIIAIIPLRAATSTFRKVTGVVPIPPCKLKFILANATGATLASSGNTVVMYVGNDEVQ